MKLAIAVPALDHVSAFFANALALMYGDTCAALHNDTQGWPKITLAMGVGTFVHQARERLLDDLTRRWDATHILWLDADMTFPTDVAFRLLRHEKEIVAANYVTRVAPHRPTAKRNGQPVWSHDATGLEKVDHVGMGVFLMKTSVLHDLPRPRFWYSTETETEDVYFCRLLRKAGREIWIDHDLSKEISHVGTHLYREMTTAVTV